MRFSVVTATAEVHKIMMRGNNRSRKAGGQLVQLAGAARTGALRGLWLQDSTVKERQKSVLFSLQNENI